MAHHMTDSPVSSSGDAAPLVACTAGALSLSVTPAEKSGPTGVAEIENGAPILLAPIEVSTTSMAPSVEVPSSGDHGRKPGRRWTQQALRPAAAQVSGTKVPLAPIKPSNEQKLPLEGEAVVDGSREQVAVQELRSQSPNTACAAERLASAGLLGEEAPHGRLPGPVSVSAALPAGAQGSGACTEALVVGLVGSPPRQLEDDPYAHQCPGTPSSDPTPARRRLSSASAAVIDSSPSDGAVSPPSQRRRMVASPRMGGGPAGGAHCHTLQRRCDSPVASQNMLESGNPPRPASPTPTEVDEGRDTGGSGPSRSPSHSPQRSPQHLACNQAQKTHATSAQCWLPGKQECQEQWHEPVVGLNGRAPDLTTGVAFATRHSEVSLLERIHRRRSQRLSDLSGALPSEALDGSASAAGSALLLAPAVSVPPQHVPAMPEDNPHSGGVRAEGPESCTGSVRDVVSSDVSCAAPALAGCRRRLHPELLGEEALKSWMLFFGMKPATSSAFMVRRLQEIDEYLAGGGSSCERSPAVLAAVEVCSKPPTPAAVGEAAVSKARRGRPKKRPRPQADDEGTGAAEGGLARLQKSEALVATKEAKAAAKAAELEQAVANAIRGDTELYERLLLFEPVEMGELRERLAAVQPELQGLGEQRLRKFLDNQGLLFANAWSQNARGHKRF